MKSHKAVVLVGVLSLLMGLQVGLSVPDGQAQSTPWYDSAWAYRRPVTITCPCEQDVENYQVQVTLDDSFDFTEALPDGSDVRITDGDGTTLIPFWVEEWDSVGQTASIWVKVPSLPMSGTTIYLYYGNANPSPPVMVPVETPPVGPWARAAGNPIIPAGDPGNDGRSLLAENVISDTVTGHYWLVFADYSQSGIGLAWSDDPANPVGWTYLGGTPVFAGNAPHLVEHGGTWYIFYADRAHVASDLPGYSGAYPNSYPVSVATATSVSGPYSYAGIMLTSTEPWEAYRVDEPYVFQRNDGKWIMMYMGDSGAAHEQVSYATADDILGPYTKFPGGQPAIPYGPPGSYDAGTVADPWVVEFHGTYYIGYTVSPTTSSPWQTAYATTTDWLTFTRHGITLPLGPAGAWDSNNSFRGAVTRFGDVYYFPYTGDSYQMGIATQDVWQTPPVPIGPEVVFPFFDDFDDGTFDTAKWAIDNGTASQVSESGGWLALTASGIYIKISSRTSVGMNYVVEARAQHPQPMPPVLNRISEFGLSSSGFANTVRMADNFHVPAGYWERQSKTSGDPWTHMAQQTDTQWHLFRTYRVTQGATSVAGFQIDYSPVETDTADVPIIYLPAFLMSYGSGNQFVVDWIRLRQYCGADPEVTVGPEELPTAVTLLSLTAEPGIREITITWETATELDNLGFNLYRADSADGPWTQLNASLIRSLVPPGSPVGAVYGYEDSTIRAGITYYYRLEAVDVYGQGEFHGPVSATLPPLRRNLIRPRPAIE
jgi:hypothetical protein